MGVGFQRMILALGENGGIWYITGSGNHIQMDEDLDKRLSQNTPDSHVERHYLWYRRIEGVIELAGADSQSSESHEKLKVYVEKHKSDLVKALFKLT